MAPASSRNALPHSDCLIVGGGPAGLMAGLLLAEWGRDVIVVDDGEQRAEILPEYIGLADFSLLKRLGIIPILKSQNPLRPISYRDHRGGKETRTVHDQLNSPMCIDHQLFVNNMRKFVRGRGVHVIEGLQVTGPIPSGDNAWIRMLDEHGRELHAQSTLVILAQGATSVFTTTQLSIDASLPETVSLSLVSLPGSTQFNESKTSTSARGILQCRPTHDGGMHLNLIADRKELDLMGQNQLWSTATNEPKSTLPRRAFFLQDSTLRLVSTGDSNLMFGAAAVRQSGIDTGSLVSDLYSAEAAALAANTILSRPDEAEGIIRHHKDWERKRYLSLARHELKWCAKETRFQESAFWMSRREQMAAPAPSKIMPHRFKVRSGLEQRVSYQRQGEHLTSQPGFACPGDPSATSSVHEVPVAALLSLLKQPRTKEEIVQSATSTPALSSFSDATISEAIDELYSLGFVENAD